MARLRPSLFCGTLLVATACGVPQPTPTATIGTSDSPSAAPTAGASRIALEDLPVVDPDPTVLTALCDPDPAQINPEAGDTSVFCHDAVVVGLRAASTAAAGPITRLYVRRPICAAMPCSQDELSTVTVLAWDAIGMVAVRIDKRLDTVSQPERLTLDLWPPPGTVPAPEVGREELDAAPAAVATRTPYPYCGRATYDTPQKVLTCFRDSVLGGRRAEAIQVSFGTEGGEVIEIVRFDGSGAITRYQQADGRWVRQRGSLILGAPGRSWTFDPWDEGERLE